MRKDKQKIIIVLVLVIILNLALFGVYAFVINAIKEKNGGVSAVSVELEGYLNKEGKVSTVKMAIEKTRDLRIRLEKYFVDMDDIPTFTKKIESLGDVSEVESITINGLNQKGNILLLDFSAKGAFGNILYLVQLVENLPFKVNVKKSYINKIKGVKSEGESAQWEGVFSVEIIGFLDDQKNDKN